MLRLRRSVPVLLTAPLLASAAVAGTPPAPALAAAKRTAKQHAPARVTTLALRRSTGLWATINLCDTVRRPNGVGLRASMPGTHRTGQMAVEFRLQWLRASSRTWRDALRPARVVLGSAQARRSETGVTWRLLAPPAGRRLTLRGMVTFEWREGHRTILRLRRVTSAGHRPSAGSDPNGYSAARCVIRGPEPPPPPSPVR